jgi:hypothetical protein
MTGKDLRNKLQEHEHEFMKHPVHSRFSVTNLTPVAFNISAVRLFVLNE